MAISDLRNKMSNIENEIKVIQEQIKEQDSKLSQNNNDEVELKLINEKIEELKAMSCDLEKNRNEIKEKIKGIETDILENRQKAELAQQRADSARNRSKDVEQTTKHELTEVKKEINDIKREKQEDDAQKEINTKIETEKRNADTVGLWNEILIIKEDIDMIKIEVKKLDSIQSDIKWIREFLLKTVQSGTLDQQQTPVELTRITPKRGLLRTSLSDESILPPIVETTKPKKSHRSHPNRLSTDGVRVRVKGNATNQPTTDTRRYSLSDIETQTHDT